jgi:hypothetical protein
VLFVVAAAALLLAAPVRSLVRAAACSWGYDGACSPLLPAGERAQHARRLAAAAKACGAGDESSCREVIEPYVFGDLTGAPPAAGAALERICAQAATRNHGGLAIGGLACRRAALVADGATGLDPQPSRATRLFHEGCRQHDPVSCREAADRRESGLDASADRNPARAYREAGCATVLLGGLTAADSGVQPVLLSVSAVGFDVNGRALATSAALQERLRDTLLGRDDRTVHVGFQATRMSEVPIERLRDAVAAAASVGASPIRYVEAVEAHLTAAAECCRELGRRPSLLRLGDSWLPREQAAGEAETPP